MTATTENLTCQAGETFRHVFTYKDENGYPIDLTGATGAMQVRSSTTINSPDTGKVLELTSAAGGIVITAVAGTLLLKATAAVTAALTPGEYHYDLEVTINTSPLTIRRIRQGTFTVTANYTV